MTLDRVSTAGRPLVVALSAGAVLLLLTPFLWNDGGPVTFLLLLAAMPLIGLVGVVVHRRRMARLRAWAAATGWAVVGSDPGLALRWSGRPFQIGTSRRVSELVVGPYAGRPCMSFAYTYTTGSGKNRTTTTFHVIAMALPTFLPTVELTPDGFGARLAKAFGGQDIRFESEDFNAAWRVQAPDAKFAHDVVHPRLMERLLQRDALGLQVRIEGSDILCWSQGHPDLDVVGPRLGVLAAVVSSVPRFVWLEHGYDPART